MFIGSSLPDRRRITQFSKRIQYSFLHAAMIALVVASPSAQAATANWSPEQQIASNLAFTEFAVKPNTAVNAAGRSVVVWDKPIPITGGFGGTSPQVYAAVRATSTGAWSAAMALSPEGARNGGATVDPVSGKVTVFWIAGGVPYASTSSDAGATWSQATIPGDAGFGFLPSSVAADTDGRGNITVILARPQLTGSAFDIEAVVRAADGRWRTPVMLTGPAGATLFGRPHFNVVSDGQALLSVGLTTFRRDSRGRWAAPQTVNLAGLNPIVVPSADIDAKGSGYFVVRAISSGVIGAYLSTSTPTSGWSTPRHVAMFDDIGVGGLQVTGSSSDRAMISGYDLSGSVRASATRDSGRSWGTLANLGPGIEPKAAGSENGLYALGWNSFGATGATYSVATGSGLGSASTAWITTTLTSQARLGSSSVAIAGKSDSSTARAVTGWEGEIVTTTLEEFIGASTGVINK